MTVENLKDMIDKFRDAPLYKQMEYAEFILLEMVCVLVAHENRLIALE